MPQVHRPQERLTSNELPPPMVPWLHPLELLRTAYHAWLSGVATSYLDRREVLAALDRDPGEPMFGTPPAAPIAGTTAPPGRSSADDRPEEPEKEYWVDFVADVGDSWEATHAIATLLAQPTLDVHGYKPPGDTSGRTKGLPQADLVVLGGDLVYPSPTRDAYRRRTAEPFAAAFPQKNGQPVKENTDSGGPPRKLVAIPGNHDWYDGLTSFVREFCQGGWIGQWQLTQMRSYFAISPIKGWWVWGIDIALDTRIDPAQQTYFLDVLLNRSSKHPNFSPGDRVILCTAKPSWLPSSRYSDDAYGNLEYFVHDLIERNKGRLAMILSGDLHHYARYTSEAGHHLITSGSAGSYLMGTHHLPAEIRPAATTSTSGASVLYHGFVRSGFTYPSPADSRRMSLGALRLAFRRHNMPFCLTIGIIAYWAYKMVGRAAPDLLTQSRSVAEKLMVEWKVDFLALATAVVIVTGCAWFASFVNRKASRWFTLPWGALHGFAHVALMVFLSVWLIPHPLKTIGGDFSAAWKLPEGWEAVQTALGTVADFAVIVLIAGWAGALLVGIYLTISDRVLRWHQNEVFAAQSIFDYRSFVRICLRTNGRAEIYPIGLRRVPRYWRARVWRKDSDPLFEPIDGELKPHLIEGPIKFDVPEAPFQIATKQAGINPILT
jgi:hypothetical protein